MLLDQIHPEDEVGQELLNEFRAANAVATADDMLRVQLSVKLKGDNAPLFREEEFKATRAALLPLAKLAKHLRTEYNGLVIEPIYAGETEQLRYLALATDDLAWINVQAAPEQKNPEDERRKAFRSTSR